LDLKGVNPLFFPPIFFFLSQSTFASGIFRNQFPPFIALISSEGGSSPPPFLSFSLFHLGFLRFPPPELIPAGQQIVLPPKKILFYSDLFFSPLSPSFFFFLRTPKGLFFSLFVRFRIKVESPHSDGRSCSPIRFFLFYPPFPPVFLLGLYLFNAALSPCCRRENPFPLFLLRIPRSFRVRSR